MAKDSNLRRRGRPAAAEDESTTTEVTSETATATEQQSATSPPSAPNPMKTVPELIEEEQRNMSSFLLMAAAMALFFALMVKNTVFPPKGRIYGIMMDAGSTGTRAQVFTFRQDQSTGNLVLDKTVMFTMRKSLADLAYGPAGTGKTFFKPLLEKIRKAQAVPGMRRRKRTPITLRATAGLRLLGDAAAEKALKETRKALKATEFLFRDEWVSVLEEEEEAAHAWTTVNYLLGAIGNGTSDGPDAKHYGALELGGASMQVVYKKVDGEESSESQEEGTDSGGDNDSNGMMSMDTTVDVLGATHDLHSTSYLGLGLFDFTKKLYTVFDREGVLDEGNPCFRKDKKFVDKKLRLGVPGSEETQVVTMVGDGDFERCVASAEITIATFSKLYKTNTKLPSKTPFYAFAYFYDRTVKLGLSPTPTKKQLIAKGKQLCEAHPEVEVKGDFDEACAEFSYIFALLKHFTNDFSKEEGVRIRFEQFVDGHMLGWALGAMLETLQPVKKMQLTLDDESVIMSP